MDLNVYLSDLYLDDLYLDDLYLNDRTELFSTY